MTRLAVLVGLVLVTGMGSPMAGETIKVESVDKARLQDVLKAAPDDAAIEVNGVTKTKAEWRDEIRAKRKPVDPEQRKAIEAAAKARFDADAKALQDQQDKAAAEQNAKVDAEFEALKAR
jgi:hypothetical protein